MQVLLTVCLLITTASIVAIAVVAIRALSAFNRAAAELEEGARFLKSTGHEVQQLVVSVRSLVHPLRHAAEAFGHVGERAAELGSAVLDEVERPVRRTVGLFRGVQAGAGYFLNRLVHSGHAAKNGGTSDE